MHPLSSFIFFLTTFTIILLNSNPILSFVLCFNLCALYICKTDLKDLKKLLRPTLFMLIPLFIINIFVQSTGFTTLVKLFRIPVLGMINITLEEIVYSLNMSLELVSIIICFSSYSLFTSRDDSFDFFSRIFKKLTLTASMSINIIHRISIDLKRVKNTMILRGQKFDQKNVFKRVKAHAPLLKVILISVLEGSMDRAEALNSKGFGSDERVYSNKLIFKSYDYKALISSSVILVIFFISYFYNFIQFKFYPKIKFSNLFSLELFVLCILISIFITLFWRRNSNDLHR